MTAGSVFGFVFIMWILILAGGGLMVTIVGPISFAGYGDIDPMLNSAVKVAIALLLVTAWIVILTKVKNWIFQKQMKN